MLVCTEKEDGKTNMAPVSFFMFTSFTPPMVAFAMGTGKNSGMNFRRTGKAILAMPGLSLAEETMKYGTRSGSETDKLGTWPIKLQRIDSGNIMIPEDSRAAIAVDLDQVIETGDHYLYTCRVRDFYGDESKQALYAWKGYAKLAGAKED